MNAYSHASSGAYAPIFTNLPLCDGSGNRISAESVAETLRPSALYTLLLLSGASQAQDQMLAHTTSAELSLLYETLDLLRRSESASAA